MLNGKVTSYIKTLVASGALSAADAAAISQVSSATGDSLSSINALPDDVQALVRDAFRQGSRYAFLSLVPWCGLGFIVSLALSRIPDGDAQRRDDMGQETPVVPYDMPAEPKDEEAATPELKHDEKP